MSEEQKSIWQKIWRRLRRFIAVVFLLAAVGCIAATLAALATDGWRQINEDLWFIACIGVIGVICGVCVLYPVPRFIGRLILRFMRALFTRRFWKWALIVFGCLAILIALFYAEEDWRGWRAWQKYKHEWEAKGEKFDFASFIPPSVPDDQNFALAPIVASTYAEWLDARGHRLNPTDKGVTNRLNLRGFNGYLGTNTFGDWRRGVKMNLEGWQQNFRALSNTSDDGSANLFSFPTNPQTPVADVLLALNKYDSAIEELRVAASLRPLSRFPLNYDSESPTEILEPHLFAYEDCARVLQLRAVAELENNQSAKALDDIKLALCLSDSIRTEPGFYAQWVRLLLANTTIVQPLWEGLAEHKWSDEQLAEIEQSLSKLDLLSDYQFALRSERAINIATIEFMRRNRSRAMNCIPLITHVGRGEKYETPQDVNEPLPFGNVLISHLVPSGWFYQSEIVIGHLYQSSLPPLGSGKQLITAAARSTNVFAGELEHHTPYNSIAFMICPAFKWLAKKFIMAQSSLDLARVACALERYRLAHGESPESLDALAPKFIKEVPFDIFNGQPLHYHRTDNAQFVLYSVGWNEKDDGGVIAFNKTGARVDWDAGDWVWAFPAR